MEVAGARTPRQRWVEEAMLVLAEGGPDAVRIEPLAKALGVTKGGFYWHFDGRGALLDEVLDAWERIGVTEVVDRLEREGGDARARLEGLFAMAAENPDIQRVDLAVRAWARSDAGVAKRLRRVDDRRMAYLRTLFAGISDDPRDVEARCLLTFSLFTGGPAIAAGHGALRRREVVAAALRLLER
jgi:AcrR family transcriptional regulator